MASRLGVRQGVHVIESSAVNTPAVIGWWRPALFLPLTAFAGLTPNQAEAILAHELAHIRRHDYLVNLLQHVTETVLFYHPGVWWVSHRMRIEREVCCDAVVVELGNDALDYALALTHLEHARRRAATLVVAASSGALADRIRRVLRPQPDPHTPIVHALLTTVVVIGVVLIVGGGYRWSTYTALANAAPRLVPATGPAAVIATVSGEPVTQGDLDLFQRGRKGAPLARVLVDMVDERLLTQRGTELGYHISEQQYTVILDRVKAQNQVRNDAQLVAALKQEHLTPMGLRRSLERAAIAQRVQRSEVFDRMTVTDEEARQYFDAHLADFPLQTFELVKSDVIDRIKTNKTRFDTAVAAYLQSLRAVARVRWTRANLGRAYADGLAARAPQAQVGTPVPGRFTAPTRESHVTTIDHLEIFATADVANHLRAQAFDMTYDTFMKLDDGQRLQRFQELTPSNRAALLREQVSRWRRLHADRLTPEQNQFFTDLSEFVQADAGRHPPRSDDVISQFLALEEKSDRLFTREEQREQSVLSGPYLPAQ